MPWLYYLMKLVLNFPNKIKRRYILNEKLNNRQFSENFPLVKLAPTDRILLAFLRRMRYIFTKFHSIYQIYKQFSIISRLDPFFHSYLVTLEMR